MVFVFFPTDLAELQPRYWSFKPHISMWIKWTNILIEVDHIFSFEWMEAQKCCKQTERKSLGGLSKFSNGYVSSGRNAKKVV